MGILIIDRQHGEKSPGSFDPGCQAIVGGRRIIETDLTEEYGAAIDEAATAAGHKVVWLRSGSYYHRQKEANQLARDSKGEKVLYLALHVNAGGGTYALSMHDRRSRGGKVAAEAMAAAMKPLEGISRSKVIGCDDIGWTRRAYYCIKGIWKGPANISGVLLEPFFIDSKGGAHERFRDSEGLAELGAAVGAAAAKYLGPVKRPAKKKPAKKAD